MAEAENGRDRNVAVAEAKSRQPETSRQSAVKAQRGVQTGAAARCRAPQGAAKRCRVLQGAT